MEQPHPPNKTARSGRFASMRLVPGLAAIVALAAGTYWALRLGYADRLFHTGQPANVLEARELAPENADYYGQAAGPSEQPALRKAVALNPNYSPGWIELGLEAELAGRTGEAERLLLKAAAVDRTYEPRWTLASFYFRRGDRERFFEWANQAATMAYQDQTLLFLLLWRMSSDPVEILAQAVPHQPRILAQYLNFLIQRGNLEAAVPAGNLLASMGSQAEVPVLLAGCDQLLERGRLEAAIRLWNSLCSRRLIDRNQLRLDAGEVLTNGDFSAPPFSAGFDWRLQPTLGVSFAQSRSPAGLRVTFTGGQPELCRVVEQVLPLESSRRYRLRYRYQSSGLGPGSGLLWEIESLAGTHQWSAVSPDLASDHWTEGEFAFATPSGIGAARLSLTYRRALGTTRIEGSLWLRQVSLSFD